MMLTKDKLNRAIAIAQQDAEAEFIWGHFLNYCKSFYSKGGVYGDEVNATDEELERAIFDLLDEFGHEFQGDSFDREKVRLNIERTRNNPYLVCKAVYQSMHHAHILKGEQDAR
jgi:hypothetical protein